MCVSIAGSNESHPGSDSLPNFFKSALQAALQSLVWQAGLGERHTCSGAVAELIGDL
jgi:hypothetical protein